MSYTPIQNRFWSDGWIRGLNALDRYLFLYLLTNGRSVLTGIYELPLDLMASESGIDEKDLRLSMLSRLEPKIYYKEGWIILKNYLKHRVSDSPLYLKGIKNEFNKLPKHIQEMAISYGYPIDTLYIPTTNRIDKNRKEKINTPELPKTEDSVTLIKRKSKNPMKRNSFGKYREDQPSDSFDDCIDLDTGEIARPNLVKGVNEAYWNLLHWSENRRKDFKFINVKKQFKAFKIARESKINPPGLQAKWIEFEKDKFWNTKGFDWMDIVTSLDRKR